MKAEGAGGAGGAGGAVPRDTASHKGAEGAGEAEDNKKLSYYPCYLKSDRKN